MNFSPDVAHVPRHHIDQTELERNILAALLCANSKNAPAAMTDLRVEYFTLRQHKLIFKAVQTLFAKQATVDLITVTEELIRIGKLDDAGGRVYVSDIVCNSGGLADYLAPSHVDYLIERYKGYSVGKYLQKAEEAYLNQGDPDEILDIFQESIQDLSQLKKSDAPIKAGEIFHKIDDYIAEVKSKGNLPGLPTGYPALDAYTGGFSGSQFILIAGRPGCCKTSFALNLALNMSRIGKARVLFYSLEMSNAQMNMRLVSLVTGISFESLKMARLTEEDDYQIEESGKEIQDLELYFCDTPNVSIQTISGHVKAAKRANKPYDIVIVDYLQLMKLRHRKDDNMNYAIGEVSRGLKLLANEENIPVVALSQLNRAVELRQNKKPILADLRDSGSLEQDADLVIGLFKESKESTTLEAILLKNRHGSTGTAYLGFRADRCAIYPRQ